LFEDIRSHGHLAARINPLDEKEKNNPLLSPEKYGLSDDDLKAIQAKVVWTEAPEDILTAFDAMKQLIDIYTNSLSYEFDHVHNFEDEHG
jgi:2-oxoglutarate dehydrogenase E1 component